MLPLFFVLLGYYIIPVSLCQAHFVRFFRKFALFYGIFLQSGRARAADCRPYGKAGRCTPAKKQKARSLFSGAGFAFSLSLQSQREVSFVFAFLDAKLPRKVPAFA